MFLLLLFSLVMEGVNDVDSSLYPSYELQRGWLTTYLESYKHSTGQEVLVTEQEVTELYIQVCKFSLVRYKTIPKCLKSIEVQQHELMALYVVLFLIYVD